MELGAEFILEANAHFSGLLVNTSLSSVQLPTNVYNKGARRTPARSPTRSKRGSPGRGRGSAGVDSSRGWRRCRLCAHECVCACARVFSGGRLISFPLHFLL